MDMLAVVGAISNVLIAAFAGAALFIAIRQIHRSTEVSALAAYENYHVMCLKYPEFATGRIHFEKCDTKTRECYCTFVLFALMTGERVLNLFPKDNTWIYAVKDDIRIHRRLISSDYFADYRAHQDKRIRMLIDQVLAEAVDGSG